MNRPKFKIVWIIGLILPRQQGKAEPEYGYYAGLRKINPKDPHCEPQPSLNLDPGGALHFKTKKEAETFTLTLDCPSRFTVMEHTLIEKN
jgi:hypothetical protein